MCKTKSMTKNQNNDGASNMNRIINTCDNGDGVTWSDLNHDVLLLVMMQLGVVDFLAFSRVCKPWRVLAVSNRNKFIVSRPPMSICVSTDDNKKEYYYLEDFEGRKLKIILPHSADTRFIGVTCGYLILFGRYHRNFWLVNPITRHELHFHDTPFGDYHVSKGFSAILVFSPSISERVLVMSMRFSSGILFSIPGKRVWNYVSAPFFILDLITFKGKIYALGECNQLGEVRLYPTPKVTLLEMKIFRMPFFMHPRFVSLGENLYVMARHRVSERPYEIHEIDFRKMEYVLCEEREEKHAFFFSELQYSAAIILIEPWTDLHSQYNLQYRRYAFADTSGKGKYYHAKMWYNFHDCLNDNLLHE